MMHWSNIAQLKLGGLVGSLEGTAAAASDAPRPEELLANRYRVKSLLGQGGFGRVLLADDLTENREVALKVLLAPTVTAQREVLDVSFRQEFYTLSKLRHPGTVGVYDFGQLPTGERYLAMELVKGRDLRELVGRGPMRFADLYRILSELAQVLGFIHSRLFVHCDIKAENIRVTDKGATKLMDFGLLFPLGNPAGSSLRGTPAYMAPEVARGGVIDQRTDLYSLGVLAFELCTGRLPFEGKTLPELIGQHLEKPPPSVTQLRADVPPKLEAIIASLLAKSPGDRPQGTSQLLEALSQASGRPLEVQSVAQRTSYLNSAELIGRDAQLRVIDEALAGLAAGKGRSLLLGAAAGVGKTRLLQEVLLKVKLADLTSALGHCRREGLAPLRPVMQAIAGLLPVTPPEVLKRVAPALAALMPELQRQGFVAQAFPDAIAERAAALEAVLSWVREVSAKRPVVLVLEDLHWADAATLEMLNALNRQVSGMAVLVIGTFRSEEVDRMSLLFNGVDAGDTTLVELPELSSADLATMVSMMLRSTQLPAKFSAALYAQTKGNCFFATESLRSLIEGGQLAFSPAGWKLAEDARLPPSIADAVARRLDTLDPSLLEFATIAAACGRVLDLEVVEKISACEGERLFEQLDLMVERQFVTRVDDQVFFTHDTVRDGIMKRVAPEVAGKLHRRIGNHLAQRYAGREAQHAALLAHHYAASDDRPSAAKYLLLAGEQAFTSRALTDASRLLLQATTILEKLDHPDKDTLLIGAWAKIIDCTFATTPAVAVEYSGKLAAHWRGAVNIEKAARTMKRMMAVINRLPAPLRRGIKRKIYADRPFDAKTRVPFVVLPQLLQYLTLRSFALGFMNRWDETFTELDTCLQLNPDRESIFYAGTLAVRALMHGLKGEVTVSRDIAQSAYEVAERNVETVGSHVTRQIYGNCLLLGPIGNSFVAEAIDLKKVEKAIEVGTRYDLLELVFQARWPLHVRACQTGQTEAWQKARTELVDVVRRLGYPPFHESRLYFWDPLFHLEQGRLDEAVAATKRLERLGQQIEDLASAAQVQAFLACVALARRDLDAAHAHLESALQISKKNQLSSLGRWSYLMADVLVARGDRAGAIAWLEREVLPLVSSGEHGGPIAQVLALRAHGEALGGEAGAARLEQGLEIAKRLEITVQEGFVHAALARVRLASDRPRAARHLDAAEAAFQQAQNPHQVELVRQQRTRATLGAKG